MPEDELEHRRTRVDERTHGRVAPGEPHGPIYEAILSLLDEISTLADATDVTLVAVERAHGAGGRLGLGLAATDADGDRITDIRIALGGVATKPWRALRAEALLRGELASPDAFVRAAEAELADALPLPGNAFKVELTRRTLAAVLTKLSGGAA